MAECHPVGFQWVMEAKARGATVIHIDPRYTRTSAVADLHVPLRAGSDIVLLGGLINYVLTSGKYFREYVLNYTNASTIIGEDFRDTEDLDGLFSGFDPGSHVLRSGQPGRTRAPRCRPPSGERDRQQDDTGDGGRRPRCGRPRGARRTAPAAPTSARRRPTRRCSTRGACSRS